MIYLAKNEKGQRERIQIVYRRFLVNLPHSYAAWGALNHDGTQQIVPFERDYKRYETVLNILLEKYPDIQISKRTVDSDSTQIVCINGMYCLYDAEGYRISELGTNLCYFSKSGEIITHEPTGFADYYEEISEIHKGKLSVARDIDTRYWTTLDQNQKVVSEHQIKETAIQQAIARLS